MATASRPLGDEPNRAYEPNNPNYAVEAGGWADRSPYDKPIYEAKKNPPPDWKGLVNAYNDFIIPRLIEELRKALYFCTVVQVKNPVWQEPPISGTAIDLQPPGRVLIPRGNQTVAPTTFPGLPSDAVFGVLGPGDQVVLAYKNPPRNSYAVFHRIGMAVFPEPASGDLIFQIRINGKPVQYYGSIASLPGRIFDPHPFANSIIMDGNQTMALVVHNNNAFVQYEVEARMIGWQWTPSHPHVDFHGPFSVY